MKNKIILLFILILNCSLIHCQVVTEKSEISTDSLYKPNYPEGIYRTKEYFIKKIPFQRTTVVPKGLIGLTKPTLNTIVHNCFFYYSFSDEKIQDVFAISYKGHLYFQISAILKNRNKTDRAQSNNFPNSFVRVILGGNNYLYTEAELSNVWAQGIAYGGIGGAVGGALANKWVYGKGLVWDFKNNEFNIFKNCEDYNEFIKDKNNDGIQTCKENQADVFRIRKDIEKIK